MGSPINLGERYGEFVLHSRWIEGFPEDAVRIFSDDAGVHRCTIVDTCGDEPGFSAQAHRDAIQLIPSSPLMPRSQYAAGTLERVNITGNHIRSRGALQGVFCSDGLLLNIVIRDNVIQTAGQHHITLNGLISGFISNNIDENGTPCPIRLEPLRIGGNPGTGNVWVVGFATGEDYRPVDEIVCADSINHVTDNRRGGNRRKGDTYLTNFDLDGFRFSAQGLALQFGNAVEHGKQLHRLALQFGDIV